MFLFALFCFIFALFLFVFALLFGLFFFGFALFACLFVLLLVQFFFVFVLFARFLVGFGFLLLMLFGSFAGSFVFKRFRRRPAGSFEHAAQFGSNVLPATVANYHDGAVAFKAAHSARCGVAFARYLPGLIGGSVVGKVRTELARFWAFGCEFCFVAFGSQSARIFVG